MALVVHPNTYHPEAGYFVHGDSVRVTADGCEVLTRTPRQPVLRSGEPERLRRGLIGWSRDEVPASVARMAASRRLQDRMRAAGLGAVLIYTSFARPSARRLADALRPVLERRAAGDAPVRTRRCCSPLSPSACKAGYAASATWARCNR